MKILAFSDIHLRQDRALALLNPFIIPEDIDMCIIAGDISDRMHLSLNWFGKAIPAHVMKVFVPGNHEYYNSEIVSNRAGAGRLANVLGISMLDDDEVVRGGIRLIGGTLWTNYDLYTDGDPERRRMSMRLAERGLTDHHTITHKRGSRGAVSNFTAADAHALHLDTRRFIEKRLSIPHDGPTIVVTHHAPHRGSIAPKWEGDDVTPAFVSDLSDLFAVHRPDFWIHGHVHDAFDFIAPENGHTRIICNPFGYQSEYGRNGFSWPKIIEI